MEFQYISDIHLEKGNVIDITPIAPYLILAGDIGDPCAKQYQEFIQQMSIMFEKVFLVAGNHEYFSYKSMNEINNVLKDVSLRYANVVYLQNEVYHVPNTNISIFGTTLWSHIDPQFAYNVKSTIADYRCIPHFTISKCNQLYEEAIEKFNYYKDEFPGRKWIVITHHLPQTRLIDEKYLGNKVNCAFASDNPCFDDDNVIAVVYGHTHTQQINGKYMCNPLGYPGENLKRNMNMSFIVESKFGHQLCSKLAMSRSMMRELWQIDRGLQD